MYVDNSWLSLDPIYLSLLNSRTILRTWMDFKMADTSERRVFCFEYVFVCLAKLCPSFNLFPVSTLFTFAVP